MAKSKKPAATPWRSRITGYGEEAPDQLLANPFNFRVHTRAQEKAMGGVLAEVGVIQNVIVNTVTGHMIDGHLRTAMAITAGQPTVPITYVELTEEEERLALATFDPLSAMAGTDEELLAQLKEGMSEAYRDLQAATAGEIMTGHKDAPEAEMDRAEELLGKWKVERGQIWQIGRHRLMCGDCTSREDVEALMDGEKAALVFTSPPYDRQRHYEKGVSEWLPLMQGAFAAMPADEHSQVLVNLGMIHRDNEWLPYWDPWVLWMRENGWRRFGLYVWDQGPGLPGDWNGRLAPSFEFVFHFNKNAERARKTKETKWGGTVNHGKGLRAADGKVSEYTDAGGLVQDFKIPDSVIRVVRHKARGIEVEHPAVFPVEFAREIQSAFSDGGDVVYDPFLGSGSSALAAEQLERICYGIEIEPKYCAVILERMAAMGVVGELAKDAVPA